MNFYETNVTIIVDLTTNLTLIDSTAADDEAVNAGLVKAYILYLIG
jgi:hypothetical protein